jgi:EF-P beta-lysylation protein EpmB
MGNPADTSFGLGLRPAPWQRSLGEAVSSLGELLDLLALAPGAVEASAVAGRDFPLRVPRAFVARMRPGDPDDPLLRQVLPIRAETETHPHFIADPLAEAQVSPVPALLHKFAGRVLLVTTGACAVHCRYCFRRHFPYAENRPWRDGWQASLDYIAADPEIQEVILSGGDPLSVHDDKLALLATALADIPHLRRLRIHTRLPIVLPERVDDALLAWLTGTRLRPVMVVHANHAREIDSSVCEAIARLRAHDVPVLNQSVLLAGVNDRVEALVELSEALFEAGAMPYYLHLLDPVRGAAHFDVSEERAVALVRAAAARLPGYLVPRLVREVPGAPAKVPMR